MAKIKQATKKTGRERKELIVAELVEKLNSTTGVVLADYKGLKHKQLEDLKKELKKINATIVITKNSLIKLSLGKSQKYADFKDDESLNLPTALLLMNEDYVEPLKKLQKAIKDFGLPKIKLGILEGQAMDEAGVLKIASLPGRETLLTQLVGMLNSPIQGLVLTLNAPIQKLAMTLNAVAQNKPADAAPAPAADSPTTEPAQAEPSESSQEPVAENSQPTPTEPDQQTEGTSEPTEAKAEDKSEEKKE